MIPSIVGDERFFERIRIVPVASERRTQIDFHQRVLVPTIQNGRIQKYRHAHHHTRTNLPVRTYQESPALVIQNAHIAEAVEAANQRIHDILPLYAQVIVEHGQPSVVGPDRPLVLSVHYGPESPALRREPVASVMIDGLYFSARNVLHAILGHLFSTLRVKRYFFLPDQQQPIVRPRNRRIHGISLVFREALEKHPPSVFLIESRQIGGPIRD